MTGRANAAHPANDDASKARQAARAAQQEKVAWIKAVGADPGLGSAAARVGAMAAFNLAYSKGHVRAKRKHLGELSGLSDATIRRAIAELAEQNYWDIDHNSGGANLYTLIPLDERIELWNQAELEWRQTASRWDSAKQRWEHDYRRWLEKEAQHLWLQAEASAKAEFMVRFKSAVLKRMPGADYSRTQEVGEWAWTAHSAGELPLDTALQELADLSQEDVERYFRDPEPAADTDEKATEVGSPAHRGRLNVEPGSAHQRTGVGSTLSRGRLNPDTPTSQDGASTSTSRSIKTVEVLQEPASRALDARCAVSQEQEPPLPGTQPAVQSSARPSGGCALCGPAGFFRDPDGHPVLMFGDDADDDTTEVECQHSMEGNLAEIRRIESESDGYWGVAKTRWVEIDQHYGFSEDDDVYFDIRTAVPVIGTMDGAASNHATITP